MSKSSPEARLVELVVKARLEDLSKQAADELQAILEAPAMRRLYVELMSLEGHLESVHTQRSSAEALDQQPDFDEVMMILREAENQADSAMVTMLDTSDWGGPAPSSRQWHDAATYLFCRAITPRVLGVVAAAAAVVLAITLMIALLPGDDPGASVVDATDPWPESPVFDTPTVVATITAQHDANWRTSNGEGALPERTLLGPNQRLTLTRGFAEITTVRGAKVLLQAPATVETTGRDNAIRLHRGKLVGRCDTPSSKGFIVHAPGLDVVDLGTEFGVEADAEDGSTVLVMEGSVRAQPAETSPRAFRPAVLEQGQARQVTPETGSLATIAAGEVPVFYEQVPPPYVQAVLQAEPVAYWRFEEDNNGILLNEIAPGRNDLVASGDATTVDDGMLGRAAWLDNSEKASAFFSTREQLDAIGPDDPFTIELWCWIEQELTQETGSGTLVSFYGEGDASAKQKHLANVELQPYDSPIEWHPGSFRAHFSNPAYKDGDVHGLFSQKTHQTGVWHHVVLMRQDNELRLYVDGTFNGSLIGNQLKAEHSAFAIGRSFWLDRYLKQSKIDEVALYGRALSVEEVQDHWQKGTANKIP